AAVTRVEGEIRAALTDVVEPAESIVDAVAQLQLSVDRMLLLRLQNAAEVVLDFKIPEFDIDLLSMQADGSSPGTVMPALLRVQAEISRLSEEVRRVSERSAHPRVKEWAHVVLSASRALFDAAEVMR